MKTFGNIPAQFANRDTATIYLTSIPYDGTSTWGKGANKGFEAFLEATENMELYDIETDSEVFRHGIFISDPILENRSPEAMYQASYRQTKELLKNGKFHTFFGGEHSISIGILEAYSEFYPDLSILQLDAHADLRQEYMGTSYNHACALHLASIKSNLIQVGVRSMDISEKQFFKKDKCYFASEIHGNEKWMKSALQQLTGPVYITLDLDVFDPSIMPSTGTPEPGGLGWYEMLDFLKKVFTNKNVVGFDIVELAPNVVDKAPDFLVAKLYYKMLTYKFEKSEESYI